MLQDLEIWEIAELEDAFKLGIPEKFLTKELLTVCNIASYYDTDPVEFLKALAALLQISNKQK